MNANEARAVPTQKPGYASQSSCGLAGVVSCLFNHKSLGGFHPATKLVNIILLYLFFLAARGVINRILAGGLGKQPIADTRVTRDMVNTAMTLCDLLDDMKSSARGVIEDGPVTLSETLTQFLCWLLVTQSSNVGPWVWTLSWPITFTVHHETKNICR